MSESQAQQELYKTAKCQAEVLTFLSFSQLRFLWAQAIISSPILLIQIISAVLHFCYASVQPVLLNVAWNVKIVWRISFWILVKTI